MTHAQRTIPQDLLSYDEAIPRTFVRIAQNRAPSSGAQGYGLIALMADAIFPRQSQFRSYPLYVKLFINPADYQTAWRLLC